MSSQVLACPDTSPTWLFEMTVYISRDRLAQEEVQRVPACDLTCQPPASVCRTVKYEPGLVSLRGWLRGFPARKTRDCVVMLCTARVYPGRGSYTGTAFCCIMWTGSRMRLLVWLAVHMKPP